MERKGEREGGQRGKEEGVGRGKERQRKGGKKLNRDTDAHDKVDSSKALNDS